MLNNQQVIIKSSNYILEISIVVITVDKLNQPVPHDSRHTGPERGEKEDGR